MKRHLLLCFSLFVFPFLETYSQEAWYSGQPANFVLINPAFAGTSGNARVLTGLQFQNYGPLYSIPGSFVSVDGRIGKHDKHSFSATASYGPWFGQPAFRKEVSAGYSFKKNIFKGNAVFSSGLSLGLTHCKGLDLYTGYFIEPNSTNPPDFYSLHSSAGVALYSEKGWLSLSANYLPGNIQSQVNADWKYGPRFNLSGGYRILLGKDELRKNVVPMFSLFVLDQTKVVQLKTEVWLGNFIGGLGFNNKNNVGKFDHPVTQRYSNSSVQGTVGFWLKGGIEFRYSYSRATSTNINTFYGSTHELSLAFAFPEKYYFQTSPWKLYSKPLKRVPHIPLRPYPDLSR